MTALAFLRDAIAAYVRTVAGNRRAMRRPTRGWRVVDDSELGVLG